MEEKIYIKTEINTEGYTFDKEDRSDAFHYSLHIKNEPLVIKQEPAEIAELGNINVQVDNIFVRQPKVDFDIKIEEIGNGLSGAERKCDICGKCLLNGLALVTHRYAHTEDTYYTCCICNCNTFHLKPDLHQHMLNVHFNLTSTDNFNALERSNTNEKPYKCDICNKQFKANGDLTRHSRIHSGEKPYACDVCDKQFTIKGNLTIHSRIHSGVKPYECDICLRRFTHNSGLTIHKLSHTNEKPYKCDICNKRFTSNGHLTVHNRIHSGEKLYNCDICNKGCRTKGNLKSHKRIHASETHFK